VTVLVGVRCSDGVVIGADSIATSAMGQFPLIHLESNPKITIFGNAVIMATTGSVGYAQRLHNHIDLAVKGDVFRNLSAREATNNISDRFITELGKSKAPNHPQEGIGFGGLMAATDRDGPYLAEFATTTFQAEMKTGKIFFGSMGSGQMLADPFLAFVCRVLWKNEMPTVDRGKFGVYWVLAHTMKLAPGKVGMPICLATLRKIDGAWIAKEEQDTQESAQYIAELEDYIGRFVKAPIEEAKAEPVPKPEPEKD
jgi:Proteasome subunit